MIVERSSNEDFISKGFNASIRKINSQETLYFPHMEVCREESASRPEQGKMLFYFHKIAFILFSKHFIDVGAVTQHFFLLDRSFSTNSLYSKLVDGLSAHAIFSSHMQPAKRNIFGCGSGKTSSCPCEVCQEHRQFHRSLGYTFNLWQLTNKLSRVGILVPQDDPSDHCRPINKSIVFFEIDAVNPNRLRDYLQKEKRLPVEAKRMGKNLLRRLEAISHQDRKGWIHLPLFVPIYPI